MPHSGFIEFQDLAHMPRRHNGVSVVSIAMESRDGVARDVARKGDANDTRFCLRAIAGYDKSIDIY